MCWMVMPAHGSCREFRLSPPGSTSGPVAVDAPVGTGPRARNRPDDVKTIQDALNRVTVKGVAGGAMPFLAVDGLCGPKTNAAVVTFQKAQVGIADGLVEPNKKTVAKLNEILDPVSDADLRIKVAAAVPIVGQALTAALFNLRAVISGAADAAVQTTAADRLNRHFRINSLSPSEQSVARVTLFSTYTRFSTAMMTPKLFNLETSDEFDLDKRNPLKALSHRRGFFQPDEADETGRRFDHIHLGLGFFAPSVTPDFASFIILHELAHFVGRADDADIEDFGRGWFDDTFVKPLPAGKRLANADCYAGFAHECRVQNPTKPGFVRTAPGGLRGAR